MINNKRKADRTTPVRLIHKHQKQITKPSNHTFLRKYAVGWEMIRKGEWKLYERCDKKYYSKEYFVEFQDLYEP